MNFTENSILCAGKRYLHHSSIDYPTPQRRIFAMKDFGRESITARISVNLGPPSLGKPKEAGRKTTLDTLRKFRTSKELSSFKQKL